MDFTQLLNVLSLSVWVYRDKIVVEGLIAMDIPMDDVMMDVPSGSFKKRSSEKSSSKTFLEASLLCNPRTPDSLALTAGSVHARFHSLSD